MRPQHGQAEVPLVGEVVVEQPARDAGLLGDAVDREVVQAALRDHLPTEVEQLLPPGGRRQAGACDGHDTILLNLRQQFY